MYENLNKIIGKIIEVEKNDIGNENANMSSATPAGQMMKFASEVSKEYALKLSCACKFCEGSQGRINTHS